MGAGMAFAAGYSWNTSELTHDIETLLQPAELLRGGRPTPANVWALTVRFLQRTCVSEVCNMAYLLCIKGVAQRMVWRLRRDLFKAFMMHNAAFFDTRYPEDAGTQRHRGCIVRCVQFSRFGLPNRK